MSLHLFLAEGAFVFFKVLDSPFDTLFAEEVETVFDDLRFYHRFHADGALQRVKDVLDWGDRGQQGSL